MIKSQVDGLAEIGLPGLRDGITALQNKKRDISANKLSLVR